MTEYLLEWRRFATFLQNEDTPILWAYAISASILLFVVHYVVMQVTFSRAAKQDDKLKIPPLIPYSIPLLGNVPWRYFWDPIEFFCTSKYFALTNHPVRVKFFTKELYIVQGPEHVLNLLGHTTTSNRIFNSSFIRHACGMSAAGVARFDSPSEEPPNYHGRKNYLDATPLYSWSSADIHTYLTGKSALQLSRRFEANLRRRMRDYFESLATTPEGIILDDFLDFFSTEATSALIDSMCGRGLIKRNPEFPKAFWVFCDNLPTFMKRTPKIFAKRAWKARDDVLAAVRDWQAWASANFDEATTQQDENGDDEYWGSKFFRERYKAFVYDLGFEPGDMASLELGFLLGASANATLNTYWCALEVFKDADLLHEIRKEVEACKTKDGDNNLSFNTTRLLNQPLLQAVFAESLRLRAHNMFLRKTSTPIDINTWRVPGNSYAVTWSTPVHMNARVWEKANGWDPHPPDVFYPYRFLKRTEEDGALQFSLSGFEGSWIPFGSGANICPGRNFAKMHALLTIAMMVEGLECDVLAPAKDVGRVDLGKFGMGVIGPKGKVAVRIRKREVEGGDG